AAARVAAPVGGVCASSVAASPSTVTAGPRSRARAFSVGLTFARERVAHPALVRLADDPRLCAEDAVGESVVGALPATLPTTRARTAWANRGTDSEIGTPVSLDGATAASRAGCRP